DRAAVTFDEPAAVVEVAREELADLLGVPRLRERGEADEVGEEDGDEPPLGDPVVRRGRLLDGDVGGADQVVPAGVAEPLVGLDRDPTGRARACEGLPTRAAEPRTCAVVGVARWADQLRNPLRGKRSRDPMDSKERRPPRSRGDRRFEPGKLSARADPP